MKRISSLALVALAVVSVPLPAMAQLFSMPVYFAPKGGTGFTLSADVGRGAEGGAEPNTTFAARASLGVAKLTIGAAVGTENFAATNQNELMYGGTVAVRIAGGGLLPIAASLQGGAAYQSTGVNSSRFRVPIGIGVGVSMPFPAFSFNPWVAPRISILRTTAGGVSETQRGLGVSGGFEFAFLLGLGIHVGFDWEDPASITAGTLPVTAPTTVGFGIHYNFRLPGLPGVPIVPVI